MFFLLNKYFLLEKNIKLYSQILTDCVRVWSGGERKKGARTSLFPRSPHLFSSSYSLLLSSASTDADARIDRRGCSYRPTRMFVTTDADARIDRRGWLLLMFRSVKPLLSCSQTVAFAAQDLPFYILYSLFLAISSSVFFDQRCFPVVCILWLQSLKQSLAPIIV